MEQLANSRKATNPNVGTGSLVTGEPMFIETSVLKEGKAVRGKVNVVFPRKGLIYDLTLETMETKSEEEAGSLVRDGIEGLLSSVGVVKRGTP